MLEHDCASIFNVVAEMNTVFCFCQELPAPGLSIEQGSWRTSSPLSSIRSDAHSVTSPSFFLE